MRRTPATCSWPGRCWRSPRSPTQSRRRCKIFHYPYTYFLLLGSYRGYIIYAKNNIVNTEYSIPDSEPEPIHVIQKHTGI